ncbi:MAG: hypothetical protein MHMPM18_004488 [Marteilia pararefringens]
MGRFRVVSYNSTLISSSQFLKPFVDIFGLNNLKVKTKQQESNDFIPSDDKTAAEPESNDNLRSGSDQDQHDAETIVKKEDNSEELSSNTKSSSNVILPVIIVTLIVVLSLLIVFLLRRDRVKKKEGLKISDENYLNFDDNQNTASNDKSTDARKFHEPIQIIQNEQPAFVIDTNVETMENRQNDNVEAADIVENVDHEAEANKAPVVVVDAQIEETRQE